MGDPRPDFKKNKEKIPTTETISGDQLVNLIYKGNPLPQDSRFCDVEEGGVFKYFILADAVENSKDKFYPMVKLDDKVVGLSELEKSPYKENVYWIKFISIDPEFQGKGYARELTGEIFKFAKENGGSLLPSYYTDDGLLKLKNILEELAQETGVTLLKNI